MTCTGLLNRIRPPGNVKGINRPVVLTGCKVLEDLVVEHHAIAAIPQPSVAGLFSIGKNIQQAEYPENAVKNVVGFHIPFPVR